MKVSKRTKTWIVAAVCTFCLGFGSSQATITDTVNYLPATVVFSDEVTYVNDGGLWPTLRNDGVARADSAVKGEDANVTVNRALAIVQTKEGYGLLDSKGAYVVQPAYKTVNSANRGHELVFSNPKDKDKGVGVKLDAPMIERQGYASDLYFPFKDESTKRYGFKNVNDQIVIAPKYKDVVVSFSEDRAFVKTEKGQIVGIDGTGSELFTVAADYVSPYNDGLAQIERQASGFNLFGGFGGLAIGGIFGGGDSGLGIGIGVGHGHSGYLGWGDYDDGFYGFGGVAVARDKVKRGYIDRDGRTVVDSKLDYVYPMMPFGTIIENDNQLAVVDKKGNFLIPFGDYTFEGINLSDSYIALKNKYTEKRGVLNYLTNKNVLPFIYDGIDFMNDSYIVATAADGKHVYKMEPTRKEMFSLSRGAKHTFYGSEGFAWVTGDSLLGDGFTGYKIIDKDGKVVFEAKDIKIQAVSNFADEFSAVKVGGKWGIMNVDGQWLVEPIYKDIQFIVPTGENIMIFR